MTAPAATGHQAIQPEHICTGPGSHPDRLSDLFQPQTPRAPLTTGLAVGLCICSPSVTG
ncbi:rCG48550 [Rattus norvegicus]|uniref:RCG48550 n=1 Tax=Rattus norvegicus TaxID=10116 RepID=A6HZQ0_RAT|nr:rCG48550 [Rattus norvegicus]